MKVLAIADVEERCLWDFYSEKRFGDVDLILSAGDLDPDYLEFLVTVTNKPLLYVRGNHDDRYARRAPGGCLCIEDEVYVYRGLRVAGLGGSMCYRDGANMYSEREMARRAQRLQAKIRLAGGVDVLLGRWRPGYMVHGHVHKGYDPSFKRERQMPCGTTVVNACGYTVLDIEGEGGWNRGWRAAWLNSQVVRHDLKLH